MGWEGPGMGCGGGRAGRVGGWPPPGRTNPLGTVALFFFPSLLCICSGCAGAGAGPLGSRHTDGRATVGSCWRCLVRGVRLNCDWRRRLCLTLCRVGLAHHISFPRVLFVFMPNPLPVVSGHDGCRHVTRPICTGDGLEKRRRCKYVSGLDDHRRRNGFPGRGGRPASCVPPLPPRPTGPTTCTTPYFFSSRCHRPSIACLGGG